MDRTSEGYLTDFAKGIGGMAEICKRVVDGHDVPTEHAFTAALKSHCRAHGQPFERALQDVHEAYAIVTETGRVKLTEAGKALYAKDRAAPTVDANLRVSAAKPASNNDENYDEDMAMARELHAKHPFLSVAQHFARVMGNRVNNNFQDAATPGSRPRGRSSTGRDQTGGAYGYNTTQT